MNSAGRCARVVGQRLENKSFLLLFFKKEDSFFFFEKKAEAGPAEAKNC
jgi:hypothetical protein